MSNTTQGMHWIRDEKRLAIYSRDGFACAYCGLSIENEDGAKLTLDHITPRSKGGTNGTKNLVTCCHACNSSRGNKNMSEWLPVVSEKTKEPLSEIYKRLRRLRIRKIDVESAKKIIESRKS